MPTVTELAREYGMHPYALREFSDDLLDDIKADDDAVPAEAEKTIREALDQSASLGAQD